MSDPAMRPVWSQEKLEHASTIIGAIDSPLRLQILLLLHHSPHVVHQLVTELQKSQPLISQHLRVLKNAGLVEAERTGREVVYSLAGPEIISVIESIAAIAAGAKDDGGDTVIPLRRKPATADLVDISESLGTVAAAGPPPEVMPETDPGLKPSHPQPTL